MVNPLYHWLLILFGTSSHIPSQGLSRFRGMGFRIPLRGLSVFQVSPGLLVPAQVMGSIKSIQETYDKILNHVCIGEHD